MRIRSKNKGIIIAVVLASAMIVFGLKNAWSSFVLFENSVVDEKDSLLYNITTSMDASISSELDTFVRECKYAFKGQRAQALEEDWLLNNDNRELYSWYSRITLGQNPIVSSIKVSKGKSAFFYNNNAEYETLSKLKNGIRICMDENRSVFLTYEYKSKNGVKYKAAISMDDLYAQYSAQSIFTEEKILLYYPDDGILVVEKAGAFHVADLERYPNKYKKQIAFFDKCIEHGQSDSRTIKRKSAEGNSDSDAIRIYVLTEDKCKNGIFDVGATTNYQETITSSKEFAKDLMTYASLAVLGATLLLMFLILVIMSSDKTDREMDDLRRRNEQMEEINRQMQVVSHHQRLETIGTMTAGLAHDFNNLLTPIMGYSMMSMEMLGDENAELYDNLLEIYNSSCKAKDIVQRLTELSRKGKAENNTLFYVDMLTDSTMKATLPVKPKNVKLHGELDSSGKKIRGDRTQISQLIMNLILNAYDALERIGGTVSVWTKTDGDNIIIAVKDDGPGMDAEVISKMFDPFYTTKESGKGTGLGLAITAQIVETHGGKIYVDSEVGKGTEFRVVFTAAEDKAADSDKV